MSNLMTSFNAGVAGLHSAQTSLQTTAHNLANATTEGYSRQQVMVTDSFYQNTYGLHDNLMQVGTGTTIALTRQVRNEFLDSQYRLQFGKQEFYQANATTALEIEDMLGELHGEEFLKNISSLWDAVSSLSTEADQVVNKEQLVSVASRFIESSSVLQKELVNYQKSLNNEVSRQVDDINNIVTQIRTLNLEIRQYEATGESANDYRDKRNLLLDKLSGYIDIDVTEEADNTVVIYSNGSYLLDQVNQYELTTEWVSETSHLLKPVWASGGDFFTEASLNYSSEKNTDVGSLKGLLLARGDHAATYKDIPVEPKEADFTDDEGNFDKASYVTAYAGYEKELKQYDITVGASVVMQIQAQLDTLVHGIVSNINDALCPNKELALADGTKIRVLDEKKALIGDDADNTMGEELFSRRAVTRYEKTTVTVLDELGNPQTLDVFKYNEEDEEDPYTVYSIDQLVVNNNLVQDASKLPTMYNKNDPNNKGYAYNELGAIADSFNQTIGSLDPYSLTTYDAFQFYNAMCSELATQTNIWNSIVDNQEITVTTLEQERQNVMGVSSDEELSDLIKFQQCYNASSRYINTISEMLEYIIEKLGG